jgi:RNA polymerase-binding transcription factor DksA
MDTTAHEIILQKNLHIITQQLKDIAVYIDDTDDWQIKTDGTSLAESDTDLLADASEAADEQVTELAELENQYKAITRALQKITAGTYGICEIAGESIEEARLSANPSARTCIQHKEEEYRLSL